MALCHITGTLFIPDGTEAANRRVHFQKLAGDVVTDDYIGAVVPEVITTKTDENGAIDVTLVTGYYIGAVLDRRGNRSYTFKATVPDQATANITDLITATDPILPLPAWLQQALQARDDAAQSASDASDDADRAESAAALVDLRLYKTREDAVAAIAGGLVLSDGSQFWAGDLLYAFKAGSTAISDMPGVIPMGDIQASHFGFAAGKAHAVNRNAVVAAVVYADGNAVTAHSTEDFNISQMTINNTPVNLKFTGGGRAMCITDRIIQLFGDFAGLQPVISFTLVSEVYQGQLANLTRVAIADSFAYEAGDIVRFASDDLDPSARTGYTARRGEHAVVAYVDHVNNYVYLSGALEDAQYYTTNVRMGRMPRYSVKVDLPEVVMLTSGEEIAVFVRNLVNAEIRVDLRELRWIGVFMNGTYGGTVRGSAHVRQGVNFEDLTYGVTASQCTGLTVIGFHGENCRHTFTTAFNTVAAGTNGLWQHGAPRDNKVYASTSEKSIRSPWDSHEGARRTSFIDCSSFNSLRCPAYNVRGLDTVITNPYADASHTALVSGGSLKSGVISITGGLSLCKMIVDVTPSNFNGVTYVVNGHVNKCTILSTDTTGSVTAQRSNVTLSDSVFDITVESGADVNLIQVAENVSLQMNQVTVNLNSDSSTVRIVGVGSGNNGRISGDFTVNQRGANVPQSILTGVSGSTGWSINLGVTYYGAMPFDASFARLVASFNVSLWEMKIIDGLGGYIQRFSQASGRENIGVSITGTTADIPAVIGERKFLNGVEYQAFGTTAADWSPVSVKVWGGSTAQRPTNGLYDGREYFDRTLGKPIWWRNTQWVDATGTVV